MDAFGKQCDQFELTLSGDRTDMLWLKDLLQNPTLADEPASDALRRRTIFNRIQEMLE